MTTTFDRAVHDLVRVCETWRGFSAIRRACLVRDLKGRVHLVVEPDHTVPLPDLEELETHLGSALGRYFVGPILSVFGPLEQARLARGILDQATSWPPAWPVQHADPITGQTSPLDRGRWCALQRVLSKEAWLSGQPVRPPWPLLDGAPLVCSFYSFKGGVGRTLLLGAMAWHMARAGQRVAVLDLDLEAPGLGTFLGVETVRGLLDSIVDHVATGSTTIEGCHDIARSLGDREGSGIFVLPSGQMGWPYLEKLSRLDYASSGLQAQGSSPISEALTALLSLVRAKMKPDTILIDSRAGLHDLGGLSLHALSHVDILVSRAGPQGYQGLDMTVRALAHRRRPEELRCVVVHSFAPPKKDSPERAQEEKEFLEQSYRIFTEHVYETEDLPQAEDSQEPHFPWVVPRHESLERIGQLTPDLESVIFSRELKDLYQRLMELGSPEPEDETDA